MNYLLTSWSRFLLEKLMRFKIVKKFSAYYGTRRYHYRIQKCPPLAPILRFLQMTCNRIRFYSVRTTDCRTALSCYIACSPDTTPTYPHLTSNLQQTKNETTNVVNNIIVASS